MKPGEGVSRELVEAMRLCRAAAEQGDAVAQYRLGVGYYAGLGVPQDHDEAVRWFRAAAEQGVAEAQYNLGFAHLWIMGMDQEDPDGALPWFRAAAEQGHVEAQFRWAQERLHDANLVAFDGEEEVEVPEEIREAERWLRAAAERGVEEAQLSIGRFYARRGQFENLVQAFKWLDLAMRPPREGDLSPWRTFECDRVAERMTPDEIAEAQRLAREWRESFAERGRDESE